MYIKCVILRMVVFFTSLLALIFRREQRSCYLTCLILESLHMISHWSRVLHVNSTLPPTTHHRKFIYLFVFITMFRCWRRISSERVVIVAHFALYANIKITVFFRSFMVTQCNNHNSTFRCWFSISRVCDGVSH